MTARSWLYGRICEVTEAWVDNRVFAKKTMTSGKEVHPYIVYKLGYKTNANLGETSHAERQFVQIWVHDYQDQDNADFMRIDEVVQALKAGLNNASSAEDGVITCEYLETSQDLNDDTLNTVFRYVRFQMVLNKE